MLDKISFLWSVFQSFFRFLFCLVELGSFFRPKPLHLGGSLFLFYPPSEGGPL